MTDSTAPDFAAPDFAGRHIGPSQAEQQRMLDALASFEAIGGGKGGYWEDRGYEWYAGI